MFKLMRLGQWGGLSDVHIEQTFHVRLDLIVLPVVKGQIERPGLKVQGARGAIVDVTIVASAARPNRHHGEDPSLRVVA